MLLTPGSAKTLVDLPIKSSHKLLSNDGQNVLDLVRAFIEVKPAESLVTKQHYFNVGTVLLTHHNLYFYSD
jgi:hypothetical protein